MPSQNKSYANTDISRIIAGKFLLFWFIVVVDSSISWTEFIDEYDTIAIARCNARCFDKNINEYIVRMIYADDDGADRSECFWIFSCFNYKHNSLRYLPRSLRSLSQAKPTGAIGAHCVRYCLEANYTKPGHCPENSSMSPFEAACLNACDGDHRCADIDKCCTHECGITCMRPVGLINRTDLPQMPEIIDVQHPKNNLVILEWKEHRNSSDRILYLVEERHLLGPKYLESRMSTWSLRHIGMESRILLRNRLKTGHWYQYRVAAVDGNGSRGYSKPSKPLKTKDPRNPKEPQSLTLSDARIVTDKLRVKLHWTKPISDVPIAFYKVFWSPLVYRTANDSVFIYHRTVFSDRTCTELRDLDLDTQYFFQVQAIALYGRQRLASRKASKVFNTSDYILFADVEGHSRRCERQEDGLYVRRMICRCGEVRARVVWPMNHETNQYNLTLREEYCPPSRDQNFHQKATWRVTQESRYDLRYLRQGCIYNVNVRNIYSEENANDHGMNIEFLANGCHGKRRNERQRKHFRGKLTQCKTKSFRAKKHRTE